ncbi:glycosyltransferase [Anaerorhabdus furcosa]|uniref:Glycosyltransferase involved in cell wall bisynthesis n=1 Tax=Anaerorhabdus furcosa TaxID=118967 RepID=A0A1T4LTA4_9FIRM|nr:glycosyltransferase [Anaerorhabdus furcosa]SJZ57960.1 Glycosyltransferase involved in cell wall bisynthesis [Anaerorhabdus furcosa]
MKNYHTFGIAVPIYNNKKIFRKNVLNLRDVFLENNLEFPKLFVSDNASTDGLEEEIEVIKKEYPNLVYHRNKENMGYDYNFANALKISDCDYTWLLGSDDSIQGDLTSILNLLKIEGDYDLIINGEDHKITEGIKEDKDYIFSELCYQMNWISGLILSKQIIANLDFDRYQGTYWSHTGAILNYMLKNPFKLYYLHNKNVFRMCGNEVSWGKKYYEITSKLWADMIMGYEGVSYELKLLCCRNGYKYGRMTNMNLLSLRAKKEFNYKMIKEDYEYIRLYNKTNKLVLIVISILPSAPLNLLRRFYIKILDIK